MIMNVSPLFARTPRIFTLKKCIEAALKNHPSPAALRKMQESKAADTKSLRGETLPELDFSFRGANFFYDPYRYRTISHQLRLTWDVGKWIGKLKEIGITEEQIARFRSRQNRLDLIFRVKQTYFRLITAREELRIARLSERYLQHHLEVSRQLFRLGQIDRLDLYFTQSELARTREKILAAQSEVDSYRIQLSNLTGVSIASDDSLPAPDELYPTAAFPVDTLLVRALRYNPGIAILNRQIELAGLQANLIRKSRLPKIYIGGGYIFDNDPTSGGNYGTISGGLQFPVLDWGNRKHKARAIRLKAASLKLTRDAYILELRTRLESLVTRLDHFGKMLNLKEETIRQAQKTYDYTERNYRAGIASNTEVLLAQKALTEAQISREKLIFTLHLIESQIENLIGQSGVSE